MKNLIRMNSYFLFLSFVFYSPFLLSQPENLLSSITTQKLNNSNQWENFERQFFGYNSNNDSTEIIDQSWTDSWGGEWINIKRNHYVYDNNQLKEAQISQEWLRLKGTWENTSSTEHYRYTSDTTFEISSISGTYFYNLYPDGRKKDYFRQEFSNMYSSWEITGNGKWTYDSLNNITRIDIKDCYIEDFNEFGEPILTIYCTDFSFEYINKYDNQNRITHITQQKVNRTCYLYNNNNLIAEEISENWNWFNNSWMPIERMVNNYHPDGKFDFIEIYEWDNNDWILSKRKTYVYREREDSNPVIAISFEGDSLMGIVSDDKPDDSGIYEFYLKRSSNQFNSNVNDTSNVDLKLINGIYNSDDKIIPFKIVLKDTSKNGYGTLIARDGFGNSAEYNLIVEKSNISVTSADEVSPTFEFVLSQNFPNPFNPSTTIKFELKTSSFVNLGIYNVLGEKVVSIISDYKEAGPHSIKFDASSLSSGTYIYKISAGDFIDTKKFVIVK